jgi:hypothetical protein
LQGIDITGVGRSIDSNKQTQSRAAEYNDCPLSIERLWTFDAIVQSRHEEWHSSIDLRLENPPNQRSAGITVYDREGENLLSDHFAINDYDRSHQMKSFFFIESTSPKLLVCQIPKKICAQSHIHASIG